jgi:PAS domain S-box-containing protein
MTTSGLQPEDDLKKIQGKYSPVSVFLITIIGIAAAEVVAMIVVYFNRHLPYTQQVLIDASVMTTIMFPILYFLSFRPILQHIQQRYQVERVLKSRLRIIQHANLHTLDETLQFTLDELEALTGSTAGYFHFIEADQTTIKLQTWSKNTLQTLCRVNRMERHYPVDEAGVWADCIRQRQVVVHNDYASLPNRKGLPEGHAPIIREMAVPVIREAKIVAVLGVGNKPEMYSPRDVELVSTLADFTWDIIKQKQTADAHRESEEKFRTLVDWTYDWELWLDPEGSFVYSSPSCEQITGYAPEEFMADPQLLLRIVHPDNRPQYDQHHQLVHDAAAGVEKVEYRIVTRNGREQWIEHICRPLFGSGGRYLGRRISNRDITERKQAEQEIAERNQKEKALTQMLYTMQLDIARDLHDTIGQNIGYLRMKLDHLADQEPGRAGAGLQAEFRQMSQVANESYDLVRGTLAVLQSQGSSDLLELFKRYASQVVERSAFDIQFQDRGRMGLMSAYQIRQLFYIFREALSNIEKHSEARHARVEMEWAERSLTLSIDDDGKGFDPALATVTNGHYGLKFIRERTEMLNGTLQLQTAPQRGTRLTICVPLQNK